MKKIVGRTHSCADTEEGAPSSNGTTPRVGIEVIVQVEYAKKNMAQTQVECVEMINDEIVVQVLDTLKEKTMQAQTQAKELTEKFQALAGEIEEAHKV
jgi:hypothetical protein